MNQNLTLERLISEYKALPAICAATDYSDKKSVRNHNRAADRMRTIVEIIKSDYEQIGIQKFQELLDEHENRTNVWVATQLLEILKPDDLNRKKALNIIEKIAQGDDLDALGFKLWLKEWKAKR